MARARKRRIPTTDPRSIEVQSASYRNFVKTIGGRDGLREIAQWNTDDPRAKAIIDVLNDPMYDKYGVMRVAQNAGVSLAEMALWWREALRHGAVLGAFSHLPAIVEDAANAAKAGQVACPECVKRGKVASDCLQCDGTGKVRTRPDKDARDFIGEITGMTGKAPLVQINQDNRKQAAFISGAVDPFETMVKQSKLWERPQQRTLEGARLNELTEATEAEIIEGEVGSSPVLEPANPKGHEGPDGM